MDKKKQRKELEHSLVTIIENALIAINPEAAKEVNDIVYGASKILAKKFFKAYKPVQKKKLVAKKENVKKVDTKNTVKPNPKKVKTKGAK